MKSVTSRNLVGGFLGGVIGILSSGQIAAAFLPLGVLVGVLIGWWNEDIVHLVRESYRKGKQPVKKMLADLINLTDTVIAGLTGLYNVSSRTINASRLLASRVIVGSFTTIITSPLKLWRGLGRFSKWFKSHQMNQVQVINVTIYSLFVVGIPIVALLIEFHPGITDSSNRGILMAPVFIATFVGSVIYYLHHEAASNAQLSELSQFYREWEVISHQGWTGYVGYVIWQHTRYALGTAVFLTIALPWFFIMGTIGMLSFFPVIFMSALARGFYKIAIRTGHLLCLGVTMAITGISWFVYHESFADPRILWSVALGTGIVSGGLTEIIRRILLPLYEITSIGRKLASTNVWDLMTGDGSDKDKDYMSRVMNGASMWFEQSHVARIFRMICFGFPVARPA